MASPSLVVRHGKLHDVLGAPRVHGDISFAPALVELVGSSFTPSHALAKHLEPIRLNSAAKAVIPHEDAVWARARVQRIFGVQCPGPDERVEKSLMSFSFVAVIPEGDGLIAIPFECSDYYGASSLTFSDRDRPPQATCNRIASAFWNLLLTDPTDVDDFEDKAYHPGAAVWISYGVESGQPFIREHTDEP